MAAYLDLRHTTQLSQLSPPAHTHPGSPMGFTIVYEQLALPTVPTQVPCPLPWWPYTP